LTLGNSATNVTVTVTTTAASMGSLRSRPLSPAPPQLPLGRTGLWMLVLAMMALALLIGRRQPRETRGRYRFAVFALRFLLTVAMAACGGGGGGSPVGPSQNPGTPSGTYSLTVTGTTGSGTSAVSHSMSLTLTVS
jgi:hypothetical protein